MAIRKDGSLIGRPTKKQVVEREMREKAEAAALKEARDVAFERLKAEGDINQVIKDRSAERRQSLSIEESINNIQDSVLGKLNQKFDLENSINVIKEGQTSNDKAQQEGAKNMPNY